MSKHSKPVKVIASILMVPKAISNIPAIVKEEIETFKTDVKDEMTIREKKAIMTNYDAQKA